MYIYKYIYIYIYTIHIYNTYMQCKYIYILYLYIYIHIQRYVSALVLICLTSCQLVCASSFLARHARTKRATSQANSGCLAAIILRTVVAGTSTEHIQNTMCMCNDIHLSFYLSIHLSIYPSIWIYIQLAIEIAA